jgi:AcrR family transcriptional regulator
MTDELPEPAKRGPKRSETSRLAILTAAYELVSEVGYRQVTIEGIAARAGCGKQTVYRWWAHKADVLLEALAVKADIRVSTEDQGSYRTELARFLNDSFELIRVPGVEPVLQALMAEAQIEPGFRERLRPFLDRRRAALRLITARAAERGELPVGPDQDQIADLVFGFFWYRMLATDSHPTNVDADALLAVLAPPPSKGSR